MAEFLMLAHRYDARKHYIGGWFWSEKLDGQRVFWDGGLTRGWRKEDVPWANTAKDSRYLREQYSTGLWTRYGHPVYAPDWWLDQLPKVMLDGELMLVTSHSREHLRTIVSGQGNKDDKGWKDVILNVFDSPSPFFFHTRRINNPNYSINFPDLREWFKERKKQLTWVREFYTQFERTYDKLTHLMAEHPGPWYLIPQTRLPYEYEAACAELEQALKTIVNEGGEGVIVRKPEGLWVPERVRDILKVKPEFDDEAIIIGFRTGKGKYLGMLGSLVVKWEGKIFDLSGFTDQERQLEEWAKEWAIKHPGEYFEAGSVYFGIGETVTFKYRGLSVKGIPIEARYFRKWAER